MNWQPIETAPKNGERILLYRSNWAENVCVGYWDKIWGYWCAVHGHGVAPWREVTHWMPLPELPISDQLSGT